jgi:8-oxo-dGTP pyrophosphatase MutT (NUDIX family)
MSNRKSRIQYAALPYRFVNGRPEVLLVTSRETRRWILPKGWAKKGVKPHEMAAIEAFEEAGVRGVISKHPIGTYRYEKRLTDSKSVECEVTVFPMEIHEELESWPERNERERRWLSAGEAAYLISESGLVAMLLQLGLPSDKGPSAGRR